MKFRKWLSALLIACLFITAPLALMEEALEAPMPEAPEVALEDYVEEVALSLGEESTIPQSVSPKEEFQEVTVEGAESESDAIEADQMTIIEQPANPLHYISIDEMHFPDATFREYILQEIDANKDEWLSEDEILQTKKISFSYLYENIASLQGIEYFTYLERLSCGHQQLTALDVSNNSALKELYCYSNQLTTLDVSNNSALEELFCDSNQLTALDVSNNTALNVLSCKNNQLTGLNISKNTGLESLYCDGNHLTTLDSSNNTALKYLHCKDNQITALDVSKNAELRGLYCDKNQIVSLDFRQNKNLYQVTCSENGLQAIYIDGEMGWLECEKNPLTSLDIRKAPLLNILSRYAPVVKENGVIWYDDVAGMMVGVDAVLAIDEGVSIVNGFIPIDEAHFPDANFRKFIEEEIDKDEDLAYFSEYYLEHVGESRRKDGWLSESEIADTIQMFCEGKNIASLKGIEYFTALADLRCSENQLTSLDVSKNTKLYMLSCSDNNLSTLDVSKNLGLQNLYCENNQLTSLTLPDNYHMGEFDCSGNKLTTLDISRSPDAMECYNDPGKIEDKNDGRITYMAGKECWMRVDKSVKIIAGENMKVINLTKNMTATINVGEKLRIALGSDKAKAFKSGSTSVATVDKSGIVTGVAEGNVKIKVKLSTNKIRTLKLKVVDPTMPTGIRLNKTGTIKHDCNKTLKLKYKLLPEGTAVSGVTWKSSNSKIATVDANGLVTPLKEGKVIIRASTTRGKKKYSAEVRLKLFDSKKPTGIHLDRTGTLNLDVTDDKTLTLVATVEPSTAESGITWKSSSSKIASVKDGVVTLHKVGNVTITATLTKIKKSAKVKLSIKDMHAPKSVSIAEGKNLTLNVGQSVTLTANVAGKRGYAPRKNLAWYTSKREVVTVDRATGTITAVKAGKAKVKVVTDNKKEAIISIKVNKGSDNKPIDLYAYLFKNGTETAKMLGLTQKETVSEDIIYSKDEVVIVADGRINSEFGSGYDSIYEIKINGISSKYTIGGASVGMTLSDAKSSLEKNGWSIYSDYSMYGTVSYIHDGQLGWPNDLVISIDNGKVSRLHLFEGVGE